MNYIFKNNIRKKMETNYNEKNNGTLKYLRLTEKEAVAY